MSLAPTAQRVQVNVTDKHGMPVINLPVNAISLARAGQIDELEDTQITDSSGTCYFSIDEPTFFRPMLSQMYKQELRIQILNDGARSIAKHAVVDKNGFGTHTTIGAAITYIETLAAGGDNNFVIHINPGGYEIGSHGTEGLLMCEGNYSLVIEAQGDVSDLEGGKFNPVVSITNPVATGITGACITFKGGGKFTLRGIHVNNKKPGNNHAVALDTTTTTLLIRNCMIESTYGSAIIVNSSVACSLTAFDSLFRSGNSSGSALFSGPSGSVEFRFFRCRLHSLPIVSGDFADLLFDSCFLYANNMFGSGFLIQETNLVISRNLVIRNCVVGIGSRSSGFVYYGNVSGNVSITFACVGNVIDGADDKKGIYLTFVKDALIVGNIIRGFAGTNGIGVEVDQQVRGLAVVGNVFENCVDGVRNSNTAMDASCTAGANAFNNVTNNYVAVPAAARVY